MMRKKGFNRLLKLSRYSTKVVAFVLAAALLTSTVAYAGEGVYMGGDGADYATADVEGYPSEDDTNENDGENDSDYKDEETELNDTDDEATEETEESGNESEVFEDDNEGSNIEDSIVYDVVQTGGEVVVPFGNYTVTFNGNGGAPASQITSGGLPVAPTRDGFAFSHWNTVQNLAPANMGTAFTGGTPTEDMTVFAQWNRRVDFRLDGSTVVNWATTLVLNDKSANQTNDVTGNPNPSNWPSNPANTLAPNPGEVFVEWRLGGTAITADTPITGNVILIAHWEPAPLLTITFDYAGGQLDSGTNTRQVYSGLSLQGSTPPQALPVVTHPNHPVAPNGHVANPPANNITLAGWNSNPSHDNWPNPAFTNFTVTTPVDATMATIHARWVYTIQFNAQGGTSVTNRGVVVTPANYAANNATIGDHGVTLTTLGTNSRLMPTTTKVGYVFAGWYNEPLTPGANPSIPLNAPMIGTARLLTVSCIINSSGTVWARWETSTELPPTITFDLNDISGPAATWYDATEPGYRELPYNSSISTATAASAIQPRDGMPLFPQRPGYVFMGWFLNPAGTGLRFLSTTNITSDITVYAHWIPYFTVTIHANGGNFASDPIRRIAQGSTFSAMSIIYTPANGLPPSYTANFYHIGTIQGEAGINFAATRSGYSFHFWNTAANGSGTRFLSGTPVTQDMTIYAMWGTPITFVNNHETFPPYTLNQSISRTVILGSSFNGHNQHANVPPTTATSTELIRRNTLQMPNFNNWPELATSARALVGWNSAPDGSGDWFSAATIVNQTPSITVFYAIWAAGVAFDPGAAPMNSINDGDRERILPNFTTLNTIAHAPGGMPNPPNWPGHNFRGWFDNVGIEHSETTPITAPLTLFAWWSANVTFNPGGGSPSETITVYIGNSPDNHGNFPAAPSRGPHWNFTGWNTETDGTGNDIVSTSQIFSATNVHAQWTTTVIFDLNGGNVGGVTSDVPVPATHNGIIDPTDEPAPAHATNTFLYWEWTNTATGVTYQFDPTAPLPEVDFEIIAVAVWYVPTSSGGNNNNNQNNNNNNQGSSNQGSSRDPFPRRGLRNDTQGPVRLERENDNDVEIKTDYEYDIEETPEEIIRVPMGSSTIYRGFAGGTHWTETHMDTTAFAAEDGSIMIPIRFLTYALRNEVQWAGDISVATLVNGGSNIQVSPAAKVMYIDGHPIQITNRFGNIVPAFLRAEHDRILIPMSALGEAFNIEYEWDADTQTAIFFPNRPLR
ncbi:MAG: InlB B-repeat-containing protein [Defluviitaleaceae bacterium]|nr:InlB B-repeat-containing protein [Defluviitaleaceae bacterium]